MSEKEQVITVEKMMQLPEKDRLFMLGFVAGMVSRQEQEGESEVITHAPRSTDEGPAGPAAVGG